MATEIVIENNTFDVDVTELNNSVTINETNLTVDVTEQVLDTVVTISNDQGAPGLVQSISSTDGTIVVEGTASSPTVRVPSGTVYAGSVPSGGIVGTIADSQLTSGVTITGDANKILKTSSTGTIDADIDAGSSTATTNKIQFRKDSGYNWFSSNPTLASGEIGVVTDDNTFKIGDGTTAWNSLLYSVARLASANAFTVGGHTIANQDVSTVGLTIKPFTSGTFSQVWQNATPSTVSSVGANGAFAISTYGGTYGSQYGLSVGSVSGAAGIPLVVRGSVSQTGDLQQWQNSAGTVLASITTTGLSMVAGNKIVSRSSATTAAINIGSTGAGNPSSLFGGDLWGTGTSLQSLVYNTGSAGAKTIAYTDSSNWAPIATTFTNVTTTAVPLIVKGAASQTANLQEWQNSAGTVLSFVSSAGVARMEILQGGSGAETDLRRISAGGALTMLRTTSAPTNPGANYARLYLRDGTTAGTLKLVVRAGAAGAETTILDNIPQ